MKITYIAIALVLAMVLLSGCVQPTPPTPTPSPTPTPTPAPIVGGDVDEHGCIPSAGYTWCEPKQKCLREWEETCEEKSTEELAKEFCTTENVAEINACDGYIQVITTLIGGGSAYYTVENGAVGEATQCPIVAPEYISEECKSFMDGTGCSKVECPPTAGTIEAEAQEFCEQPNVAAVYVCGEYARVVGSMEGAGSTFYKLETDGSRGNEIQCPIVAPSAMSEECVLLTMGSNCIETQIC